MKEKESNYWFNEGRLRADQKWVKAIDERINELEKSVGIPELRKLKQITKYKWNLKEEIKEIQELLHKAKSKLNSPRREREKK